MRRTHAKRIPSAWVTPPAVGGLCCLARKINRPTSSQSVTPVDKKMKLFGMSLKIFRQKGLKLIARNHTAVSKRH
jgi:hypothetical protein